jgi:hypothetical protein
MAMLCHCYLLARRSTPLSPAMAIAWGSLSAKTSLSNFSVDQATLSLVWRLFVAVNYQVVFMQSLLGRYV